MLTDCLPLRALLLTAIGWVSREQQRAIEYLVEESRVVRIRIPSCASWERCRGNLAGEGASVGEEGPSRGHVGRGLEPNGRSEARIGQGVGSSRTTTSRHPSWGAGESGAMR